MVTEGSTKTRRASTLPVALEYLAAHPDHFLFPLAAGRKEPPCLGNNLADKGNSSTDPAQIEKWAKRYPGCNWGLSLARSDIVVIDVDDKPATDKKPAKTGTETWEELATLYGPWPKTLRARTPSGGLHHYYSGRHIFGLGKHGLGKDLDSPNYVLIPGCTLADGTSYQWLNDRPIVPVPDLFYAEMARNKHAGREGGGPAVKQDPLVELDQPHNVQWAIEWLTTDARVSIQGDSGDATAVIKVAPILKDHGISVGTAYELMREYWNERCRPPWDLTFDNKNGLYAKIANAYNYLHERAPGEATAEHHFAEDVIEETPEERAKREQASAARKAEKEFNEGRPKRPQIILPMLMNQLVREAQRHLLAHDEHPETSAADRVFQYNRMLAHLSRNLVKEPVKPGAKHDKKFHVDDDLVMVPANPEWLLDRMSAAIEFVKLDTDGKPYEVDAPARLAHRMMALGPTKWKFPKLRGTVECPTLRPDGTVLQVAGYDAKSGLYYDPAGVAFPPIDDRPTKEQAMAALDVLKGVLVDFPFNDDDDGIAGVSQSVALAAMLTSVVRRSLKVAPAFGFTAHEAATGKTELAQIPAIMATGRKTGERPLGWNEEERTKAIGMVLDAGDAVCLYDNVDAPMLVGGAAICGVVTSDTFETRRLGSNSGKDKLKASTATLMLFTGNNLTAAADMCSRIALCKIISRVKLAERQFKFDDLESHVIEIRPKLVVAALTILRAFAAAGRPAKSPPRNRFRQWQLMVAEALTWLGEADPCLSFARAEAGDPVKEMQWSIMRAWIEDGVPNDITTNELLACHKFTGDRVYPQTVTALMDAAGLSPERGLSAKAATAILKGMTGAMLGEYRLRETRYCDHHAVQWWVENRPAGPTD
jgi:Bifunctional DNA primase/polymerase, N-terminal